MPTRFAEIIEQRIRCRTATRAEWHALRRFRSRHRRGVPAVDLTLAGPVIMASFARAARAYLRSPEAQALRTMTRRLTGPRLNGSG